MKDAALVRVMNRTRDLGEQGHDFDLTISEFRFRRRNSALTLTLSPRRGEHAGRTLPIRNPSRQRSAFNQLHAEVMLAVVFADFVNGNDVRMIEPRGSFGFRVKTL